MDEQTCEGPGGAGKASGRDQPGCVAESQEGHEDPGREMQQRWESQWQEFFQTLQSPHSALGNPQLSETAPWDDAKAFLASFEQVAEACRWPRGEWVARLMPALSGEAQQAFSLLEARDKEDYGKVKAAILREDALRREMQRQHFRQFCCQELEDPRRMYSRLQELCCRWLKPERHTKEQILELLVLEQFLASLPVDVQGWIRAGGPDSCAQAVALLEDFLLSRRGAETGMWQEPLQEWPLGPLDGKEEPLDMVQGETSKEHAEIFRDTKQNVDGEVALPGTGISRPTSLLPPEGQDVAETELSTVLGVEVDKLINSGMMGAPLHVVECCPMQSSQRTTFWSVLQEGSENMDSLEGSLSPQLGLAPHPVKKEETFFLDLVQSPRLPGQESDEGKGTRLRVKNCQVGANEPMETLRRGRGTSQENVPLTAEVLEERCKSNRGQGMQPLTGCKEYAQLIEGLGAACSNPSTVDTEEQNASFSKYGTRYHPKSELVLEQTGEEYRESPPLGEKIQLKSKLDKYHSCHMNENNHDCPGYEVSLHSNTFAKHQIIHTGEKTYKCRDCRKSFSEKSDLLKHQINHTRKKPYKCRGCGKSFAWKSHLLNHEIIHTGRKPHKCPDCGKSFAWRSALLRHEMIHTREKPHKCSECGKGYIQRSDLLTHQMIHTGKKPYQCSECGKRFSQRSYLLSHHTIHTKEKPHKCRECGKSFSWKSHLLNHEIIHTGSRPHKCPDCGKSFSWKSALLRHEMLHTGEKPHKCSECGKGYIQRSGLLTHQMIHTGKKPHQSSECGKRFSQRSYLLSHHMVHTKEKPHKCPYCGKSFSWKSHLLNHEIIHTGRKPHKCPDCGKSFSWKSALLRHEMLHTGEKPHTCPDCGKGYIQRSNLLTHQMIHTGKKPHQCPECGKRFSQRSYLLSHRMIHTNEKPHKGVSVEEASLISRLY